MRTLLKAWAAAPYFLAAFASFYLLILTIAAWARGSAGVRAAKSPSTRFAVLVPAHDEEQLLPRLLDSLNRQDYPPTLFSVYVVADNWTDRTAETAHVWGEMPTSLEGARGQNLRWEVGRLSVALRQGPQVVREAIRHRRWRDLDSVVEQGLPPPSLVGAIAGALVVGSVIFRAPLWVGALAWGNVAALTGQVLGGSLVCRVPASTYLAFVYAPRLIAWKCALYVNAPQQRARTWEPTRRSSSANHIHVSTDSPNRPDEPDVGVV